MGLGELVAAGDAVESAILQKPRTGLVKPERDIICDALLTKVQNPLIITDSRINSRFTSGTDLLDVIIQIRLQIQSAEQRGGYYGLVLDWQRLEYGKPVIRHLLILNSTANQHIVISVSPIRWHTSLETVNPLGKEIKIQIPPLAYHLPTFIPPLVCILQQKIRSKTGKHHLSTGNLVGLVPLPLHGQVKSSRLSA